MTLFMKGEQTIRESAIQGGIDILAMNDDADGFMCFEELPVGFDEQLLQYEKQQFVFTNFGFSPQLRINGLYQLQGQDGLIQLF
jgi:CRISPR-associated protein Cas5h